MLWVVVEKVGAWWRVENPELAGMDDTGRSGQ